MKAIDLTKYNWEELQKMHDNGLSINVIKKHINVSNTVINRAIKEGYIIRKHTKATPPTEEVKNKISSKLKLAHKENRHPGWTHINSRLDKLSYPERFFKQALVNEGIFDQYRIEQQLSIGKYFLDFAFIQLKLNVEIDGSQHFRDNKNIEHDKIRNEFLNNKGWKIYRIPWLEMFKNPKNEINKFISFLNNIENESDYYYDIDDIVLKRKPKYGTREQYFKIKKQENNKKQEKYINLILNSDIDFSKFGWVNKVAEIINQKPQKVNQWMKNYMFNFYNEKCFKRNKQI